MPETMLSSVVLPLPDGPTTETNVSPEIVRSMSSITRVTVAAPVVNSLTRSRISMEAMSVSLS